MDRSERLGRPSSQSGKKIMPLPRQLHREVAKVKVGELLE